MRSFQESLWIIAYDSPSNSRRRKVAHLLEGYGVRVQWSVFECRLRGDEARVLEHRLRRLIRLDEDSVRLWPLPESSCARILQLGRSTPTNEWHDPIV